MEKFEILIFRLGASRSFPFPPPFIMRSWLPVWYGLAGQPLHPLVPVECTWHHQNVRSSTTNIARACIIMLRVLCGKNIRGEYRIAGNFRGAQFSRMATLQSFRGLNFAEAGDHAYYTLYNRTYFAGLIFADSRLSAKTTKIRPHENFPLYGSFYLVCGQDFDRRILHDGASRLMHRKRFMPIKFRASNKAATSRVQMVMWLDTAISLVVHRAYTVLGQTDATFITRPFNFLPFWVGGAD
jgi:hypothetical protein